LPTRGHTGLRRMGLRFSPGTRRRHDLHAPGIEDGRQASRSATLLRRTNPKHEHGDALFRGRVSRSVAAPASEPDGTTTDRVEHDHGIWRRRPLIHIRGGEPLGVVRRGPRVHKSHGPPKPSPDKSRRGKSIFSVQWLSSDRGNGPLSSTRFSRRGKPNGGRDVADQPSRILHSQAQDGSVETFGLRSWRDPIAHGPGRVAPTDTAARAESCVGDRRTGRTHRILTAAMTSTRRPSLAVPPAG